MAQTTKEEKSQFLREKSLIDPSLKLVSLQTEKPLTHPASCHHAKGSTTPPPSGGPLKHDRREGWGDGGCKEKAKKKEAERSLQAVKCSQPQYIAYGLTFSCLTQHRQYTAQQLYQREPRSCSTSENNVLGILQPILPHSPIQKHVIKSVYVAKQSDVPALDRLWPSVFMGKLLDLCSQLSRELPKVCP